MEPFVVARIAEFRYPRCPGAALRAIELDIRTGECLVITGPAAAGKTTLCYCLTGVIPHFVGGRLSGEIHVAGHALSALRLPEIAARVGFILQRPQNQLFNVTVGEDVAFGPENLCLDRAEIRQRVDRGLSFLGMQDFAPRLSSGLSGGETQRIVLCSVLAMNPSLLVLDQPAAELDPAGRTLLYHHLERLNKQEGKTIVLVEDRLAEVLPFATRLIYLEDGQIKEDAPPKGLAHLGGGRACRAAPCGLPRTGEERTRQGTSPCPTGSFAEFPVGADASVRPGAGTGPAQRSAPTPIVKAALMAVGVSFQYPKSERWALRDVNLRVEPGRFAVLMGANGAGKSTLAKNLAGLLRPTLGKVIVGGENASTSSATRFSPPVGYLFQDPDYQLFCNTVFEEVAFGLKRSGMAADSIRQRVEDSLDRFGLLAVQQAHPYTLSRGQRQRLALAAILVHSPKILVADEPASGLDWREGTRIMDLLADFRASGAAVLVISHDNDLTMSYASRVIVMEEGRVIDDFLT